ncbi:MAG: hypothetical protein KDA24_05225 [Deltaproteobacteria bacterium]|nr:hypothetical protein [Deltaproteobacteria bacterium]
MRWRARQITLGLTFALLVACPKKAPELVPPAPGQAPIDGLLALAERTRADLALPRADEAGYHVPTSYDAIDKALAEPLAIPSLGASLGVALDGANDPASLFAALEPVDPAGSNVELPAGAEPNPPGDRRVVGLPLPSELVTSPRWPVRMQHLPAPWPEAIAELALLLEEIDENAASWDRRGHAPTRPARAAEEYFIDGETGDYRFLTHPVGVQLEFLAHAGTLDHAAMRDDAQRVLDAARAWAPRLQEAAAALPESDGPLLQLETALGAVILGNLGPDNYESDALLIIDPGGRDRWTAGAGSNVGIPGRAALALDLGGSDSYTARRAHAQGAGFLGIGVLVDAGPEGDRYLGMNQAQGAGFMGVGVLWDAGGDDGYTAAGFAQGAGTFGIGLLVDEAGDDSAAAQGRAQGFGSTGGLGAFIDFAGNDQRRLGTSGERLLGPGGGGGQGAGFGTRPFPWSLDASIHGGVGLLYDRAGNDSYFGRGFAQGAGWFLSLGLLLERAGRDRYTGQEWSQGAANHLAAGLLQDAGGNDIYSAARFSQAAASDRSVAILHDQGPDADGYRLGSIGPGTQGEGRAGMGWARQSRALAMLVDEGGDDVRRANQQALATGVPAAAEGEDPLAVLLDLGGVDSYELGLVPAGTNPADGAAWFSGTVGVAQDVDPAAAGVLPIAGWSPWPTTADAGFSWAGPLDSLPAPPLVDGDLDGGPASLQRWIEARGREWLVALPEEDDVALERVREAARKDRSARVRRAAGLALLSAELPEGLDAVIDSLSLYSADHDPDTPAGSLAGRLQALTGQEHGFDAAAWKLWWQGARSSNPLEARLPGWRLLERARLASSGGDPVQAAQLCDQALDMSGGAPGIRRFAGSMMGRWAALLANPETGALYDPAVSADLARRALQWDPGGATHFATLGRALEALGEVDLAKRAAQQGTLADPDDPDINALRRRLGLEPEEK